MTEQEKIEIIEEVEKRLEQKYKGCLSKEETQVVLKNVREKWFHNPAKAYCKRKQGRRKMSAFQR